MSLHLDNILKDLSEHKRSRDILLKYYINKRLDKSLDVYINQLNNSKDFLSNNKKYNKIIKAMEKNDDQHYK